MRRSPRILIDGLGILAALACAGPAVGWVVNVRWFAAAAYEGHLDTAGFVATEGTLCAFYDRGSGDDGGAILVVLPNEPRSLLDSLTGTATPRWAPVFIVHDPSQTAVVIADWLVILLGGAFAAWRFRARRTAGLRAANNLCAACGYDLRATPERCPECGTVPAAAATGATKA